MKLKPFLNKKIQNKPYTAYFLLLFLFLSCLVLYSPLGQWIWHTQQDRLSEVFFSFEASYFPVIEAWVFIYILWHVFIFLPLAYFSFSVLYHCALSRGLPYKLKQPWHLFFSALWTKDMKHLPKLFYRVPLVSFCTQMLSFCVFILFPTTCTRPDPSVLSSSLAGYLLRFTWYVDAPVNVFPSLHVALCFCYVLCLADYFKKYSYLIVGSLWTLAIIASTLFTKQHHLPDALLGLVFAYLMYKFSFLLLDAKP